MSAGAGLHAAQLATFVKLYLSQVLALLYSALILHCFVFVAAGVALPFSQWSVISLYTAETTIISEWRRGRQRRVPVPEEVA